MMNFKKKSIENILHSISDFTILTNVCYWCVDNIEYLNSIIDGYLDEINDELYNSTLNNLYKSDVWKQSNNKKRNKLC